MWILVACALAAQSTQVHRVEHEGWEVRAPAGWKLAALQGRVAFGSDVEPGLIVAWHDPASTWESLQAAARAGLHEQGVSLLPQGPPQELKTKGGHRALSVALAGVGGDGVPIAARAYGVLGPSGAVGVLALTTPQEMPALEKRARAVADAVKLFAPKAGQGADRLRGAICTSSGNASFTSSKRMTFDGRGTVLWGSELLGSGTFKDGLGDQTGSWTAHAGDQHAPSSRGRYTVQGDAVSIAWGDGSATRCTVHYRQPSGLVTELSCDGTLWGATLCD